MRVKVKVMLVALPTLVNVSEPERSWASVGVTVVRGLMDSPPNESSTSSTVKAKPGATSSAVVAVQAPLDQVGAKVLSMVGVVLLREVRVEGQNRSTRTSGSPPKVSHAAPSGLVAAMVALVGCTRHSAVGLRPQRCATQASSAAHCAQASPLVPQASGWVPGWQVSLRQHPVAQLVGVHEGLVKTMVYVRDAPDSASTRMVTAAPDAPRVMGLAIPDGAVVPLT